MGRIPAARVGVGLGIEGITDRTRLKLYRDELVRYLQRGMLDYDEGDGEFVEELTQRDRDRMASEVMRINEWLGQTTPLTREKQSHQVEELCFQRTKLLTACADLCNTYGGNISRSTEYSMLYRDLRKVNSKLFELTGKKY